MIQHKNKINLINWELVSVNPNDKTWDWKDIFCFWGINIQSVIAFSLITSLYLVYDLNVAVVFLGSLIGSLLVYFFANLIGKPLKSKEIGQIEPLTFLSQCFLNQYWHCTCGLEIVGTRAVSP